MEHRSVADGDNASARSAQAPAEVDLFHVGEKRGVETADGFIVGGAHHQAGAAGPVDVDSVVVLPVVGFDRGEYAAAAIGIAVAVEESACSTGIFEHRGVAVAAYLGLAGRYVGMSLHIVEERCQPVVFDGYVAVEQYRVAVVGLA